MLGRRGWKAGIELWSNRSPLCALTVARRVELLPPKRTSPSLTQVRLNGEASNRAGRRNGLGPRVVGAQVWPGPDPQTDQMDRIRLIMSERTGGCLSYAECNGTASTMGATD